jgi:hypothetical protein
MLDIIKHQRTAASLATAQALSADDINTLLTWSTHRILILNAAWLTPVIGVVVFILWGLITQSSLAQWLLDKGPWLAIIIMLCIPLYRWTLPHINYARKVSASLQPVNYSRKVKLVHWSHWYGTIDGYLARVSLRNRDPLLVEYHMIKRVVHTLRGRV